ncbi:MAG: hypothetical protein ACI4EF_12550 [Coprococcus sp.]
MYYIKMGINISNRAKNEFVVKWMIPFFESSVKDKYYFTRSVNLIPVINVYIDSSESMITYIYSKLQSLFDRFIMSLDEEDKKENTFYIENQKNIRKVNGYQMNSIVENLTITYGRIDKIPRAGEYNYPIDKEIYTDYFFKCQKLLEQSISYLYKRDENIQLIFLFGLFYCASKQLDKTGVGSGYLSFKSHLLGFLSYNHKDIDKYREMFKRKHIELSGELSNLRNSIEIYGSEEELKEVPGEIVGMLLKWEILFSEMYNELLEVEKKEIGNKSFNIKLKLRHRNFRTLSSFHKEAFSGKNTDFFKLKEFQAYRMLVNYVYLLLPAMGLSSRKRVEASYLLVSLLEGQ